MSKFEQINTFVKVADNLNFAQAARTLKISTAAVSKQISQLEDELKTPLFYRSTRRVELSELGKIYLQQCKRILHEIADADALISQAKREPSGHLRITSGRHFANHFIVPYLAEFMTHYPQVQIHLELAERTPDLEKENIDILIGMSIPGPHDAIQRVIGKTRYLLCASPDYLKKFGIPERPKDLTVHHYIAHSMRLPIDEIYLRNQIIQLKPVVSVNDTEAMLECAIQGMGIVKLHEYVVQQAIREKKLIEVLKKYRGDELSLYLCYQPRRYVEPKIRAFIDFTLKKIGQSKS